MLNWNRFESLPGAATENFEKLCRSIVRRQFGFLGPLRELKNQPGVEYHIELNQDDERLGNAGQNVGWQCKWFQYKTDGNLTSSAKGQIKHSLDRTREHLPDLNCWILWTHKTLSKPDQDWYYDLKSEYGFELHLWNESDLDQLLSGPAIDLRQSYFGELALTPQMLAEQHEISVAPIKSRWIHGAHQRMQMERKVRQILGEPDAWGDFESTKKSLLVKLEFINKATNEPEYQPWRPILIDFADKCEIFSNFCAFFQNPLSSENIDKIDELLEALGTHSRNSIQKVLRQLRRNNLPLSIAVTNALAYIKDVKLLLESAQELLSHQLVAVVADAGGGKTQFAAEITASSDNRPAGVLLFGRSLKAGCNLDSLAQQITFYNQPVSSFSSLIAAIDAAGARAGCRLPIVIDGLNEAQDPREWKPLLEAVHPTLRKFKNVVLICTLRTGERDRPYHRHQHYLEDRASSRENFAQQALPNDSYIIESDGFDKDLTVDAIKAYFKLYKIDADPFMAPLDFFSHPLNLKIFCEVTNRKAEQVVQIVHFPSSIYSLFKELIQHSAATIAGMTNLVRRYRIEDVERAVYIWGEQMWEQATRSVLESSFRESANMPLQGWDEDIVNLLAQEGVLFRDSGDEPYSYILTPVYDRLGGYLIADYLLRKNTRRDLVDWMQHEGFLQKIFGDIPEQHELSEDILHALIALTPKYRNQQQVWQALPSTYAAKALLLSYLIDHNDFSIETKDAYKELIIREKFPGRTLEHLREVRIVVGHPLNADFLSEVLKQLSVSDRDLSWTENNRIDYQDRIKRMKQLVDYWRSGNWGNLEVERLRAISISWLLTSTCIELRDSATEALFNYGLHAPDKLFKITEELLNVNDPYVSERLLAASYSVATTLLLREKAQAEASDFAKFIYEAMFADDARAATTHLLAREYASGILQVVYKFVPGIIDEEQLQAASHPFPLMPRKDWEVELDGERSSRSESPFPMDFEYTIGRLVHGRSSYDYKHSEYRNVRGKILWRIKELGWDAELFSKAERNAESDGGYSFGMNRPRIERYGKKYSWVAFYEMAGQLEDEGKLESWGERFAADIDPFFPINSSPTLRESSEFLGNTFVPTEQWVFEHELPDLSPILTLGELNELTGPWVLIHGYISEESKRLDRNFYCSVTPFFVSSAIGEEIQNYVNESTEIEWPHDLSQVSYIYSGELYWSAKPKFEECNDLQVVVDYTKEEIDQSEIVLNGKILFEGGKKVFDVPQYRSLTVQVPVIRYYWEHSESSYHNISRDLLAPWVVESLGLKFDPTNFCYTDSDGFVAAVFVDQKGEASSNYRKLLYLRQDLVETLAEKKEMDLIWRVHGERRYARTEHFHSNKNGSVWYKAFEFIKTYQK
ncbi:NACHT domain-containing protein [Methylobacter luteus]|uniref:hypothetical protein n=1 Tax=Methylobacter luteus TaxID=415 RepID=UPI0004063F69|nr:hypothetical protein [Methylobacter luteus]